MADKSLIHACHYRQITLDGLRVRGKLGGLIQVWSQGDIRLTDIDANTQEITQAQEEFSARRI